jgi:hypothetical protein
MQPPTSGVPKKRDAKEVLSHWLSWALPVVAVVLPIFCFSVSASIPAASLTWGEGQTALGRGDFLIPVLILCGDAMLRWFFAVKYSRRWLVTVGVVCCLVCFLAVVTCLIAFTVATSSLITPASTKAEASITWMCFLLGGFSGLVAAVMSAPKAAVESGAKPPPPRGPSQTRTIRPPNGVIRLEFFRRGA